MTTIHQPEVRNLPLYERGTPQAFREYLWRLIEADLQRRIDEVLITGKRKP